MRVCVPVCLSVCLSVASHISETSEAIGITFDTVTVSVMRMHHVASVFTFSEVIQQYARIRQQCIHVSSRSRSAQDPQRHVDLSKLNCVSVFQEGVWHNGYCSFLSRKQPPGSIDRPILLTHSV